MTDEGYLNAQYSVLGSLIIDPEHVAGPLFASVREDDILDAACQTIFKAARELFFSGRSVDPVVIDGMLGGQYTKLIAEMMRVLPTATHWEEYARICRECSRMRRARQALYDLYFDFSDYAGAQEAVARASMILSDSGGCDDVVTARDMVAAFFDRHTPGRKMNYLPWGFKLLDKEFRAELGDYCILGGYSSAGKSMLAVQIALRMAEKGLRVGYFSLETNPKTKLADRVMAYIARVPLPKIKDNDLSEADMAALTTGAQWLSEQPIEFFPASGFTVADIQARTLAKRYQVIFIDYVQLIAGSQEDMRQRVTAISMGLHTMAQRHGVAVIGLSQLTRPAKEEGKPKRPSMFNLKESGQLEQDADEILLLYAENPDDRNSQRRMQIAKNKDGTVDSCLLDFDGALQTFSDPKTTWKDLPRGSKNKIFKPREDAIDGQGKLVELTDDEGGEIPF